MLRLQKGSSSMSDESWRLWLQRAKSNLARAELGKQTQDILYEDLCFDAQQSAEKALKCVMILMEIDVPKTHSIGYLIRLIQDSEKISVPEPIKEAAILTDYAVTTRYPGDWEPVDEAEYKQAVALAKDVFLWVSLIANKG